MKRVREVLGAKRLFRDHWIICTENSGKESRIDAKSPFPKSNAIFCLIVLVIPLLLKIKRIDV